MKSLMKVDEWSKKGSSSQEATTLSTIASAHRHDWQKFIGIECNWTENYTEKIFYILWKLMGYKNNLTENNKLALHVEQWQLSHLFMCLW